MMRRHQVSRLRSATRRCGGDRGAVLVLTAMSMLVLLGIAALAIDLGNVRQVARHTQVAVDSASLAGAQDLPLRATDTTALASARSIALDYVALNLGQDGPAPVAISCPSDMVISSDTECFTVGEKTIAVTTPYTKAGSTIAAHNLIHVAVCRPTDSFFSGVIGQTLPGVCRDATARRVPDDTALTRGLITLHETACRSLSVDDDSEILVPLAGIHVNSSCDPAMNVEDDWQVRAINDPSGIRVNGGLRVGGGDSCQLGTDGTTPCMTPSPAEEDGGIVVDPFRDLPEPSGPSPTYTLLQDGCPRVPSTTLRVCRPGTHTYRINANQNGSFKPTFLFHPGEYRLEGGLSATDNTCMMSWDRIPGVTGRCSAVPADIEARLAFMGFPPLDADRGVMLYFPPAETLKISDRVYFGLAPRQTGVYAGISIFQARNQPSDAGMLITGDCQAGNKRSTFWVDDGSRVHLGTIYAPESVVWIEGDASIRGAEWTVVDGIVATAQVVLCDAASLTINVHTPPSALPVDLLVNLED